MSRICYLTLEKACHVTFKICTQSHGHRPGVFPLTYGILLEYAVQTCKMTMLAVRIHRLCPYGLKHKTSKSTQVLKACIILINYDVSWIKKFVNCLNSDVKN